MPPDTLRHQKQHKRQLAPEREHATETTVAARVSHCTKAALKKLAEDRGTDISKLVARLIREELARAAGSQKADPSDWRKAAGLTQEQAAEATGISRTYMSQIERGKAKNLTLSTARKLAALYHCSVSELNIDL